MFLDWFSFLMHLPLIQPETLRQSFEYPFKRFWWIKYSIVLTFQISLRWYLWSTLIWIGVPLCLMTSVIPVSPFTFGLSRPLVLYVINYFHFWLYFCFTAHFSITSPERCKGVLFCLFLSLRMSEKFLFPSLCLIC